MVRWHRKSAERAESRVVQPPQPQRVRLSDLYAENWTAICRYLERKFGAGPPEPEDMTQAAFAAYAALEKPEDVQNPRAFLFRTAHNIALKHIRYDAVRQRHATTLVDTSEFNADRDDLTPERVIEAKEHYTIVESVLEKMAPKRRRMLVLSHLHDLSYAEISRRTGVSQTQVKRLVSQGLVELRDALTEAQEKGQESEGRNA